MISHRTGFEGADWIPMDTGSTDWLYGISGAPGGGLYAVGWAGSIFRWVDGYDGNEWSRIDSDVSENLFGVMNAAPDPDMYVVGDRGAIVHYDGFSWSRIDSQTDANLKSVWGRDGEVFIVGDEGTILEMRYSD